MLFFCFFQVLISGINSEKKNLRCGKVTYSPVNIHPPHTDCKGRCCVTSQTGNLTLWKNYVLNEQSSKQLLGFFGSFLISFPCLMPNYAAVAILNVTKLALFVIPLSKVCRVVALQKMCIKGSKSRPKKRNAPADFTVGQPWAVVDSIGVHIKVHKGEKLEFRNPNITYLKHYNNSEIHWYNASTGNVCWITQIVIVAREAAMLEKRWRKWQRKKSLILRLLPHLKWAWLHLIQSQAINHWRVTGKVSNGQSLW